jgi:hypothetical protein
VLPEVNEASASVDDDFEEELRSWAIQFKPSDLETELWNARKVKIYDVDINEFVEKLRARGV